MILMGVALLYSVLHARTPSGKRRSDDLFTLRIMSYLQNSLPEAEGAPGGKIARTKDAVEKTLL
jgi:hypothetical protein